MTDLLANLVPRHCDFDRSLQVSLSRRHGAFPHTFHATSDHIIPYTFACRYCTTIRKEFPKPRICNEIAAHKHHSRPTARPDGGTEPTAPLTSNVSDDISLNLVSLRHTEAYLHIVTPEMSLFACWSYPTGHSYLDLSRLTVFSPGDKLTCLQGGSLGRLKNQQLWISSGPLEQLDPPMTTSHFPFH